MSSSFISAAELERMKQAELERQRQDLLRKIEAFNQNIINCRIFSNQLAITRENVQAFCAEEELLMDLNSVLSVLEKTDEKIHLLTGTVMPSDVGEIERLNSKIATELETLKKTYDDGISGFSKRISLYNDGRADLNRNCEFAAALSEIEKTKNHEYSDVDFGVIASIDETEVRVNVDSVVHECFTLINNSAVGRTEKSQLMGILDELQKSQKNHNAVALQTLIAQYKSLCGNVKRNIRIFNNLYSQYCALHIEYVMIQDGNKDQVPAPLPKHSFDSIMRLEQEIRNLDQKNKLEKERSYIRKQIDSVMDSFGYSTVESIVLKGSLKGHHFLFESQADAAPVHLYMSEGNCIMMETVGLDVLEDDSDTEYDGLVVTEGIIDSERQQIYENQKGFCGLYPKIVEELKKRGVLIDDKQQKKADIKSVKQIQVKGKVFNCDEVDGQSQAKYWVADQKLKAMQNED